LASPQGDFGPQQKAPKSKREQVPPDRSVSPGLKICVQGFYRNTTD
jgi:hypothetical protein